MPRTSSTSATTDLPTAVRTVLASTGLPLDCIGLQVQAITPSALPLASLNAETLFRLASTTKLVTTLGALSLLGPRYRWRTSAHLTGPLHEGRLAGDLLIVGGGNALLQSHELQAWFGRMQAQGLQEVLGDIVLDRDAFRLHEQDFNGTPPPAADRPHHAWPDALSLDEGRLRVQVRTGAGGRAQLSMWPQLAGVRLDNRLDHRHDTRHDTRPGAAGCTAWAQWQPPSPGLVGAEPSLAVRGQWGRHCGAQALQLAPLPHDAYTHRAVLGLWTGAGGRLRGRVIDKPPDQAIDKGPGMAPGAGPHIGPDRGPDSGPAPVGGLPPGRAPRAPQGPGEAAVPWSIHQSDPLALLVRDINKTSDNFAARNLMLSLAPGFPRRAATLAEARERLAGWLLTQGLGGDDLRVDNGSGLSRAEQGKPRAMVQLLRGAWGSLPGQALLESLPVAGIDGTLAHRMTRSPATGRAFLKTGSLLDTRALAGYVYGASDTLYAVAALVNHADAARATPALDRVIEWVALRG